MYKYISKDLSEESIQLHHRNQYKNTMLGGLAVRLTVLLIIFYLFSVYEITPYYISDDSTYDRVCERYLNMADSAIDMSALESSGASKYLSPFWPCFACIITGIFGTTWAVRFVNIFFSCLCIHYIYTITMEISGKHKTALLAARLYAYMPYSFIVCCFPIKDVFLTMGVLIIFLFYIRLQKGVKVTIPYWLLSIAMFVSVSETRGAVVEFLLLVAGAFLCVRFVQTKQYLLLIFVLFVIAAFLLVFGGGILNSFTEKMDSYFYKDRGDSTIALVRIDSIAEIYKLPVTYLFSQIMPLSTSWFSSIESDNLWGPIISRLNVSAFPIAIGNFLYLLLCKKKSPVFYYTSFAMYCAVIILSLGIYRHYYFLLPLAYINFAMYSEEKTSLMSNLVTVGSFALAVMMMIYSIT